MDFNFGKQTWTPEELDLLTLIEPLACVQHSYRRLPETLVVESACVLGGGPIGSLHVIEIRKRFPDANIQIVDPSEVRRAIVQKLFPRIDVKDSLRDEAFDLLVVATSDPLANLSAIQGAKPMGTVIHFSGLNHRSKGELIEVEGIDIEKVHRNEEIRVLNHGVRLVGSSGYSRADISRSIQSLQEDPETYSLIQTSVVDEIDSVILIGKDGKRKEFSQPVVAALLKSDAEYLKDLKVVFRVGAGESTLQVSPKRVGDEYQATLIKQEPKKGVRDGYIRMQVLRFSICNTDRRVLAGTKAANITDSFILGHEGIGTVLEVGAGVDRRILRQGLSLILPHFYEVNDPLLKYGVPYLSLELKHLGIHIDGCFATYVDVPAECVFPIEAVLARNMTTLEEFHVA